MNDFVETDSKTEPCSFKTCVAFYRNDRGNIVSIHEKSESCFAFWTIGRDNELAHMFWSKEEIKWSDVHDQDVKIQLDQDNSLYRYNDTLILLDQNDKITDKYQLQHEHDLKYIVFCKLNTKTFRIKCMYKILETKLGNRNYLCILENEIEYKIYYCSIPEGGKTFHYSKPLPVVNFKSTSDLIHLQLDDKSSLVLKKNNECKSNRSQWILSDSTKIPLQKVTTDRAKKLEIKVKGIFQLFEPSSLKWWKN